MNIDTHIDNDIEFREKVRISTMTINCKLYNKDIVINLHLFFECEKIILFFVCVLNFFLLKKHFKLNIKKTNQEYFILD